jgi:RNA polymerase sigma factor (sigma-70 family)
LLVSDLTRVYTENFSSLRSRAFRYLHNDAQAEEVVQEAFLKVMLAAPEIQSEDHLLAYLRTTITNLCTDIRRSQGRGPLLVAVDEQTSQEVIDQISAAQHDEMVDAVARAEDSAIVRQAISRLTPSERAILLAWDVEGLSTEEIAAKFALKPASVKRLVFNARRNLRTILETWVVDEKTGTTAAQMLSTSYKAIADNSKKIGGAALSLVLLVSAFFGFWNNPAPSSVVAGPIVTTEPTAPSNTPTPSPTSVAAVEQAPASSQPSSSLTPPTASATDDDALIAQSTQVIVDVLATMGTLGWPGFDSKGRPVGFTVNNGGTTAGEGMVTNYTLSFASNGAIIAGSDFITIKDGINVLLQQKTTVLNGKLTYTALPMVRINGQWTELQLSSRSIKVVPQGDGTWVITAYYIVDTEASKSSMTASGMGLGTDAASLPGVVATRLHVTPNGQPIIGQAVQVLAPLAGQA